MTRLLLAQRNTPTEQAELQRVTAQRGACKHDLSALNKPQRHQSLNLRIGRIDGFDRHLLALLHRCECVALHYVNTRFPGRIALIA